MNVWLLMTGADLNTVAVCSTEETLRECVKSICEGNVMETIEGDVIEFREMTDDGLDVLDFYIASKVSVDTRISSDF